MTAKEKSMRLDNLPSLKLSWQEVSESRAFAESQTSESLRRSARFDLKHLNFGLITIQKAT